MKSEVVELAHRALAGSIPMLELRGIDLYAHAGGDIDIVVPSGMAKEACRRLADRARSAGWYLLWYRDLRYVSQVILVRASASVAAVKVDFISGFEWYGVGSNEVSRRYFEMLDEFSGNHVSRERLAAAATLIQKFLGAGVLHDRDQSRVRAYGTTLKDLYEVTKRLGLPLSAAELEASRLTSIRKWRLRAASAGVHGWLGAVSWFPRVVVAHLRFKLGVGTCAGAIIGLSGLDGSGKSTQLSRLLAAYEAAGGEQPRQVHLLPAWIPMPHKLLRRKQTERNYLKPYAEAPVKSRTSGLLRLCYYVAAFVVAKAWMHGCVLRGKVILMDRSFVDFAADLARARIPDFRLPASLIRLCAPRGTLLFLDASPETVVRRKGELTLEKATDLRERYRRVLSDVGGNVVDADVAPEITFGKVIERIDGIYRQRLYLPKSE